jgi:hypothetical protein
LLEKPPGVCVRGNEGRERAQENEALIGPIP